MHRKTPGKLEAAPLGSNSSTARFLREAKIAAKQADEAKTPLQPSGKNHLQLPTLAASVQPASLPTKEEKTEKSLRQKQLSWRTSSEEWADFNRQIFRKGEQMFKQRAEALRELGGYLQKVENSPKEAPSPQGLQELRIDVESNSPNANPFLVRAHRFSPNGKR